MSVRALARTLKYDSCTTDKAISINQYIQSKLKEIDEEIAYTERTHKGIASLCEDWNPYWYLAKVQLYREGHAGFEKLINEGGLKTHRVICNNEKKYASVILVKMFKVVQQEFKMLHHMFGEQAENKSREDLLAELEARRIEQESQESSVDAMESMEPTMEELMEK